MSKKPTKGTRTSVEAFTFGDPVPVLDQRDFLGYFQSTWNGRWYEPPFSFDGLAKTMTSNPHHQSAISYKVNLLATYFRPHQLLTRAAFRSLAMQHLVFGSSWLRQRKSPLGNIVDLRPTLSRWTREGRDGQVYLLVDGQELMFEADSVLQLTEPDVSQEIYGLPTYMGAMQSALLNEAATLFRRKYYVNGSHAGFILYLTDAEINQDDVDGLRSALKQAKGPGNFRNLFMHAPGGKKDGLQLIPVSEVSAKDDFWNMKNVTRDDVLAAHRVPPQLLGIVPSNNGGFGSVAQAAQVFFDNEIRPLQSVFEVINDWIGQAVVAFDPYQPTAAG